jgi:hypothetical protein
MVGHAEARKRRGDLQLSLIVSPDRGPWASPPDDDRRDRTVERDVLRQVVEATGVGRYRLRVDFSERDAALLDLARECGDFEIQMERLAIGDYHIDSGIIVERKTYADFAISKSPSADRSARRPHACSNARRSRARVEGRDAFVGGDVAASTDSRPQSGRLAPHPAISRPATGKNQSRYSPTIRPKTEATRIAENESDTWSPEAADFLGYD